jgi:hypothetical protein
MKKGKLHKTAVFVFYAVAIASFVTLVPATLNYLEFWVALSHLYLQVDSFTWSRVFVEGHNVVIINASLFLSHNSSYVGLKLHSVDIRIEYGEQFEYLYERRYWFADKPLDPFAKLALPIFNETLIGADDLANLLAEGNQVQLYFSTSVNMYLLGQSTADRVYLDTVNYTLLKLYE